MKPTPSSRLALFMLYDYHAFITDRTGETLGQARHEEPEAHPGETHDRQQSRPIIKRLGLGPVALVIAILFGGIAAASWVGGEPFLTMMGAIGCLMTLWVGALTLVRG